MFVLLLINKQPAKCLDSSTKWYHNSRHACELRVVYHKGIGSDLDVAEIIDATGRWAVSEQGTRDASRQAL